MRKYLFTSESVGMGHPDKVADQISDAVLDAIIAQDKAARVAVETLATNGLVIVSGEVTTSCYVDVPAIAREVIREVGYTNANWGFNYETCGILTSIHGQSPDISQGVTEGEGLHPEMGAGDQGLMFGYACDETPELMPMPIVLAHRLMQNFAELRSSGKVTWMRPDGKSQVTIEYHDRKPVRVHTVVCSVQHDADVSYDEIRKTVINRLIKPSLPKEMLDSKTIYHINPTGRFVMGGPMADTGLTGRKIIVDTYGGRGRHGGGAFSGKDPSKVDRTGAYFCRFVARQIVKQGLAKRAEIQVAYAIGMAQPISVKVDTFNTGDEQAAVELVKTFDFRPRAIIDRLNLLRPIYRQTTNYGHFGKPGLPWEA